MEIKSLPIYGKLFYDNERTQRLTIKFTEEHDDESYYGKTYTGEIIHHDLNPEKVGSVESGWDADQFEECSFLNDPTLYSLAVKSNVDILMAKTSTTEVIRIDHEGRIFWKSREVETDDEFRSAMLELANHFKKNDFN